MTAAEPTTVTTSPQKTARSFLLWACCVLLVAAVGVAWSTPRAKPPWIFAFGFGAILAIVSIYLAECLDVRLRWPAVGLVGLVAGLGVWSTLVVAALQADRRGPSKAELLDRFLSAFPQEEATPSASPSTMPGWRGDLEYALERRYGDVAGFPRWEWAFLADGLLACGVAGGVLSVVAWRSSRKEHRP
jgi:hypothetical protein